MRVRMFAALREAAGTDEVDVAAATLPALLETLGDRYGPTFKARLAVASILVDGTVVPRDGDVDLEGVDEVALLPPVSGGASEPAGPGRGRIDHRMRYTRQLAGTLVLLAVLAGTLFAGFTAFAVAVTGLAALVLVDLSSLFTRVGARPVVPAAVVAALGGPLLAALDPDTAWERLPTLLAVSVLLAFSLVVMFGRRHGVVGGLSATAAVATLGGAGAAGLLLLRASSAGVQLVGGYLALVAVAELLGVPPGQRLRSATDPFRQFGPLVAGVVFVAAALLLWLEAFTYAVAGGLAVSVGVAAIAGRRLMWSFALAATEADVGSGRARSSAGPGWATAASATALLAAPLAYAVVRALG